MEGGDLSVRNQNGAVPEDERDDKERHSLGDRVESVTEERCPIRTTKGFIQGAAVDLQTIILSGQRRDGLDSCRRFTSNLSGMLVRLLVLLVLEDDDTLKMTWSIWLQSINTKNKPNGCNQWRQAVACMQYQRDLVSKQRYSR